MRIPDADTGLVMPDYDGGSIVNVAASILDAFGVASPSRPLRPELLPIDGLAGAGGTVLLVLDALGSAQLEAALRTDRVPHLTRLIAAAPRGLQRITSIFPSTTTAALNSLATACPPSLHGVLGHMLWFEEIGAVLNMLTLCPIGASQPIHEDVVRRVPTIYQRLAAAHVPSTLITDAAYEGTPFTNLLAEGARIAGYCGLSQIHYQLELALQAARKPGFYSLYWPLIDTLSHHHGPDHAATPSAACLAEMEFVDLMVGKVADLCRRFGCTLAVIADHGQVRLQPERAVELGPELCASLQRPPAGARRAPYLTGVDVTRVQAEPGLAGAVQLAIATDDAIDAGWFGGPCEGLTSRLGDTIVLAAEGVQFLYDYGRGTFAQSGSHSGMTNREMHVPLIVVPGN
ncbi:MAG: alkaline phosphatase family protein [bacterium]|nr:alkaline phosphatase family protein [bacterium]